MEDYVSVFLHYPIRCQIMFIDVFDFGLDASEVDLHQPGTCEY